MFNKTNIMLMLSFILLTGCAAESAPSQWEISQTGTNQRYQAHLNCETRPETGPFQNCMVRFTDLQGSTVIPANVLIDGGMPLHGHGLPTSPLLTTLEPAGTYRIDGLKYNMPGAWLLGFKVFTTQGEDKIIFDFVI